MSGAPPSPPPGPPPSASRLASAYVLGAIGVALAALMLMRGFGRLLLPLLLIGGVAWIVNRVIKKVREPID